MTTTPPMDVTGGLDPSPLRTRLAAAAVNTLVPGTAVLVGWGAALHAPSALRTVVLALIVAVVLTIFLLRLWWLARRGRSPGLTALGLSLLSEDTHQPLGWRRAAVRQLLFLLLAITGIGLLASVAVARKDERRRTLHDRAVRSVLVRSKGDPGSDIPNSTDPSGAESAAVGGPADES